MVIAHVGGRYADLKYAHDGRLERTVEVHSSWGTFEWLLHDAFEKGYRVGVVCHSDDHKGRPGATRPGASTFGAIGGLTCYFMPELTRDALFDGAAPATSTTARPARASSSTCTAAFDRAGDGLLRRPASLGRRKEFAVREARMGDIIRPGGAAMTTVRRGDRHRADRAGRCAARHAGRADGATVMLLPTSAAACACSGRARNIAVAGAKPFGRASSRFAGNRIARFAPVNFLNPERKIRETARRARRWHGLR